MARWSLTFGLFTTSLAASSVLAQLPVVPYCFPISSALPSGIEFRWKASDLNGVSPLNYNWVDEIQGQFFKFDIVNSWVAPTVGANFVHFAGNSTLSNNIRGYNFPIKSGGALNVFRTLVFMVKPIANHSVNQNYYLATTDAGGDGLVNISGVLTWSAGQMAKSVTTNSIAQSWIVTQTNIAANGSIKLNCYTNGVLAAPFVTTASQFTLYRIGGAATLEDWLDLYEIISFTNASRGFTQAEATQVETYRKNTYP